MYQLKEEFLNYDDNKIPYTVVPERHTAIEDLHAAVDERGFVLKSVGNRWIVQTPILSSFELNMKYSFNYLAEYDTVFHLIFGYDKRNRCGQGLRVVYHLLGGMSVSYITVDKMKINVLASSEIENIKICDDQEIELSVLVEGSQLRGQLFGHEFSFDIQAQRGYIAFERKNFIGEQMIHSFSITTDENFPVEELLPEQTVEIPMLEGGDIPYLFTYKIEKIAEICYLYAALSGGTATREINREDRPGQYVAEKDMLTSPFIILRSNDTKQKFSLFQGEKIICDPNIFWECQKEFLGHPEFPICGRYVISEADLTDNMTISYGYESLYCSGYRAQGGGPSEYIYDKQGCLLYGGDTLEESSFALYSPSDKYATTLIPENAYRRDAIIHHLAVNHYFHTDEGIQFTLCLRTKLNPQYFSLQAEIRDVYDENTISHLTTETINKRWLFNYEELQTKVKCEPLPMGVYRIAFTVYYGEMLYKRFVKVFEVFSENSDISPAVASGLPYTFSMPNEQKWLMSNTFDLWNPKPSCDEIHYISCVTNTPIEAEKQRVWEVAPIFGRKWFAWLTDRTCRDWSMESHPDVVKNADFLYVPAKTEVFPLRNDLYLVRTYQNPEFRAYLHRFLEENPTIAEKVLYRKPEKEEGYQREKPIEVAGEERRYEAFTYAHLKNLLEVCHKEWFAFVNQEILKSFREQNEEIKRLNPKFKRSAYGPFNTYVTSTLSYHTIKSFGNIPYESLRNDVYTGFAIFEDYPASCAYQTYRGAFSAMTILLHCPDFVMYPEQYKGGGGGCIDGAVKFAHSPMGKYIMPDYFNSTHAFEYVYNTAHYLNGDFAYWRTYGFHRSDHLPKMAEQLVRDWKIVGKTKPLKPMKTMAMVTEYYDEEDVYNDEIISLHGHTNLYNTSEEGHGFIYDCARNAGLNAPFALKFESLKEMDASLCDVLILPTLKYVEKDVIVEIRRLYNEGVALVAVSDVDGLEDLFGVALCPEKAEIASLITESDEENIYPNEAQFKYIANGADVIISSDNGIPVLMQHKRTMLLNASVSTLGRDCFEGTEGKTRKNISRILRNTIESKLVELSKPLAIGDNVGITLFESEKGNRQLLCIDYSPYTNTEWEKRLAKVRFNTPVKEIDSEGEYNVIRNTEGMIEELLFNIKPHETVMFQLN